MNAMSDPNSYFNRMLRGEIPKAPVLTLLGSQIEAVDIKAGTLSATYEARADFLNPAGTVQGGMLSAMLDDLTASLVDATLATSQGVATLNLNISFLRPAQVGQITGSAQILRRGRDVCHVSGSLMQHGKEIATAVAVCKIVPM
jgi:uncharacterized protein (TIGR00369 family)